MKEKYNYSFLFHCFFFSSLYIFFLFTRLFSIHKKKIRSLHLKLISATITSQYNENRKKRSIKTFPTQNSCSEEIFIPCHYTECLDFENNNKKKKHQDILNPSSFKRSVKPFQTSTYARRKAPSLDIRNGQAIQTKLIKSFNHSISVTPFYTQIYLHTLKGKKNHSLMSEATRLN